MPGTHLSNDAVIEFFERLAELFDERRGKDRGSIFLTQKCMIFGVASESNTAPETSHLLQESLPPKSLPIIIRATCGKSRENKVGKTKIATIVQAGAMEGFFARYTEVCKSGMSSLKKRDRSKVKKKMKAKKKKVGNVGG